MVRVSAGELRSGWPLLLACMTCYGLALTHLFTLGLFMEPLQAEFGWTRSEISGALLTYSIIALPGAPLVGWLVDRKGVRTIAIWGMALYALTIGMLSLVGADVWTWWFFYTLVLSAYLLSNTAVWVPAVSARFNRRRGIALAITLSGSGVAAFFLPPAVTWLIDEFGWRSAYVALGASIALISLPLIYFNVPRGLAVSRQAEDAADDAPPVGLSTAEALRSSRFLRLFLVYLFFTAVLTGLNVHFVPMLTAFGADRYSAAFAASMIGIGSIAGRLVTGFLLDRSKGPMIGALVLLPAVLAIATLLLVGAGYWTAMVALLFGFAFGAEIDVVGYLSTRYFGFRNFGSIYGVMTAAAALAAGFGPTLAGWAFDRFGDYNDFLAVGLAICVICIGLVASLGRYPDFAPVTHSDEGHKV